LRFERPVDIPGSVIPPVIAGASDPVFVPDPEVPEVDPGVAVAPTIPDANVTVPLASEPDPEVVVSAV
jgi:hypothetical protein